MHEPDTFTSPRLTQPDVAALTRAMARGDEAAYRQFYDAYFDRLLRYLFVVTGGNETAAREALQAALIRVVRHVKPFATEEQFWGWLTVLARTALADETKKQRRWFAFLERFSRHAEHEFIPVHNGEADEKMRQFLAQQVASLSSEERELVSQKYYLQRSVREIADAQQTTEKAVESKLSRVRRKLKDGLFADLKNDTSS